MVGISIIMPTFNSEKYIKDSIRSVQAQTYTDWELLIIDDVSLDNTVKIAKQFSKTDNRIKVVELDTNGGPAKARNVGLQNACGDFIAFLDSDDVWLPEKLEKQLEFINLQNTGNRKCVFCCTAYELINENGDSRNVIIRPPVVTGYWKALFLGNPIGNLTVLYNRQEIGEMQVPLIKKRNDFALWLKILRKNNKCYGMQNVLAQHRIRKDSVSANKFALLKYQWELYHKIERQPLIIAVSAMISLFIVKGIGFGRFKV
jgi:glycosyltransferase involved in cell wall biosynthesis